MGARGGINILRHEQLIVLLHHGLQELIAEYYDECGFQERTCAINWERYALLEHEGIVKWYGMRVNGKLVGMVSLFITKPLHYCLEIGATVDMIFLSKPYRKLRNGDKMLESLIEISKKEGAQHLTIAERLHATGGLFGKVLAKKGFKASETSYVLQLGGIQ